MTAISAFCCCNSVVVVFVYFLLLLLFLFAVLRDCGDPGEINNAVRVISRNKNHWAGEYVRYLCNPGYAMVGPAVRRCLPSGGWSGNTPICKSFGYFRVCSDMSIVSKGKVIRYGIVTRANYMYLVASAVTLIETRLRVIPHFSPGIVERALAFRSLYYP